jgi:hypothetical protein
MSKDSGTDQQIQKAYLYCLAEEIMTKQKNFSHSKFTFLQILKDAIAYK